MNPAARRWRSTVCPTESGLAARTDDRDRAWLEQPSDRGRLGPVLAGVGHGQRVLGRLEVERQPRDTVVELVVDDVAGLLEHPQHLVVGGQDVGHEPRDASLPGRRRDVLEEDRADAAPLVGVLDVERHLGGVLVEPLVADDADHLVADRRDECHAVVVVDDREALDVALGQLAVEGEEAEVDGLVRQPGVEALQPVGVVGPDRPQVGGPPVAEHDVGLPVRGIAGIRGRGAAGIHGPEASEPPPPLPR